MEGLIPCIYSSQGEYYRKSMVIFHNFGSGSGSGSGSRLNLAPTQGGVWVA